MKDTKKYEVYTSTVGFIPTETLKEAERIFSSLHDARIIRTTTLTFEDGHVALTYSTTLAAKENGKNISTAWWN